MKICFKCGFKKSLDDFYKHSAMPDGHVNKCIKCNKDDVKKNYAEKRKDPEFIEKDRKRGRDKYHRLNYINNKPSKEVQHKRNLNYKNLYPEKCKARNKAQYLKKSFKENHLHHWSYNEEHYKDCIELDVKTHHLIHRFIVYDQERMMYRALDGLLLNTKELHLEYINKIILQN